MFGVVEKLRRELTRQASWDQRSGTGTLCLRSMPARDPWPPCCVSAFELTSPCSGCVPRSSSILPPVLPMSSYPLITFLFPLPQCSPIAVYHGPAAYGARQISPSSDALTQYNIEPLPLASKEHLGILNGTAFSDLAALFTA
ncbi:hypothetical protein L208DRAFT_1391833 [Tricholoma matsutake]|nr:hypothetical protein L208DRAFT_1391833 [Tricholoma matsutake 945]